MSDRFGIEVWRYLFLFISICCTKAALHSQGNGLWLLDEMGHNAADGIDSDVGDVLSIAHPDIDSVRPGDDSSLQFDVVPLQRKFDQNQVGVLRNLDIANMKSSNLDSLLSIPGAEDSDFSREKLKNYNADLETVSDGTTDDVPSTSATTSAIITSAYAVDTTSAESSTSTKNNDTDAHSSDFSVTSVSNTSIQNFSSNGSGLLTFTEFLFTNRSLVPKSTDYSSTRQESTARLNSGSTMLLFSAESSGEYPIGIFWLDRERAVMIVSGE